MSKHFVTYLVFGAFVTAVMLGCTIKKKGREASPETPKSKAEKSDVTKETPGPAAEKSDVTKETPGPAAEKSDVAKEQPRSNDSKTSMSGKAEKSPHKATVQGFLDKNLIRRVIRRNLRDIQFCYVSVALPKNVKAAGTVRIEFIINLDGTVKSSAVLSSTLNQPAAEACIIQAVKKWRFPKPEGGIVSVSYPFNFRPTE